MEKPSQIAWKIVSLRQFFPLKVVPLIEVLLYVQATNRISYIKYDQRAAAKCAAYLASIGDKHLL
jgi:hypothetical protein